ncbi:MAG: hypothetical protein ABI389_06570 [Rhodanobacter sp.]
MQLRSLFATLAVAAGVSIYPAHAQTTTPCEVYTCMAGISGAGATGGPACAPSLVYWHTALAVYSPYFNPPASALRRRTYLMTCPGAQVTTNAVVLSSIIATWGYAP